ncbi:MAG: efflux RND transporter periplasmic adaptor subunit [Candidatus Orphnella occulta]|nr:efflux RND transporter periplasmic adaptor subunit [Candidatus Orphnella occulta]
MIRNNKSKIAMIIIILAAGFFAYTHLSANRQETTGSIELIQPVIGDVMVTIATTGVVEPQNRLEIKPSIGGRIDEVSVDEGDFVKKGQALAWMSSTERAALIDAARSQGDEVLAYWQEAYKKSPIISPIDGEIIVRSVEPGQTVTTADAILVLSNRLMINAQFDETDIGKVEDGQKALITLDAYPDVKLEGIVDHIAYESEIVSNVTIYAVDILPKEIPEILRSGMSVSVEVVEKMIKDVITISSDAVNYDKGDTFVLVQNESGKSLRRDVVVGLNNGESIEIVSGLSLDDKVIIGGDTLLPKKKNMGNNPFMPSRKKK